MKSFRNPAVYLIAAIVFTLAACKKSSSAMVVQLTAADSNKTISVVNSEKIVITLANPGDGGFNFDSWQYNSSVLKLIGHTRNYPANSDRTGDFGSDTWQFNAIASGTSILKITASRNPADVVTLFNGTIHVK
ncbi:MAG: hypothetical protein ACTHNW_13285 [Mucilaginibacter sp.]